MSLEVHIEPSAKYLHVTITGAYNFAAMKQNFIHILERCTALKLSAILIDVRQMTSEGPISTIDRFEFGEFVAAQAAEFRAQGLTRLRVAALGTEAQVAPHFTETVAVNRGLPLKTTTDLAEALAWLGVEPEEDNTA